MSDPRWITGELVGVNKGKKLNKLSKTACTLCWINKDNQTKRIKKDKIEIWLNQGWKKGRI